ncbi:MAG: serine protease [Peptococcaceae bacterium]|nr:serine protease [Peptococcaceae bacterium]
MMKQKHKLLCLGLALSLPLAMAGCGEKTPNPQEDDGHPSGISVNLMENITDSSSHSHPPVDITEEKPVTALSDFGVKLLQQTIFHEDLDSSSQPPKNTLISPLSIMSALGMTANGAAGDTKSQMEEVFGLSVGELNGYLSAYIGGLPADEKGKLSLANAIWFKDDEDFTVNEDFLKTNGEWYGAEIYKAPFNDATCKTINGWVKNQTDGMIENILDNIPENAIMYLVNALAFDGKWEQVYHESDIHDGVFTTENGTEQKSKMMYSEEYTYLEDENATGYVKYYDGKNYAFAVLLPNRDVKLHEYINTLTGEKLQTILTNASDELIKTSLPKFTADYDVEMSNILVALGMKDAFDEDRADFSALGSADGNLAISRVLHKTHIAVDEAGTKAGAATAVEIMEKAAMIEQKSVYLDRPFLYMIIDTKANLPIFIGTVETLE